jgi:hypothetical protein
MVYGSDLALTTAWRDWRLSLRELVPVKGSQMKRQVDVAGLESVRVALSRVMPADNAAASDGCDLQVESVALHPLTSLWRTRVGAASEPILIFDAESDSDTLERRAALGYRERLVPGRTQGRLALRVGVARFDRWLREVSCRHWFGDRVRGRGGHASLFDTLTLVVRADAEGPNAVQIALANERGSTWGAVIPLQRDWQEVRLPLEALSPLTPPQVPHPWPLPVGESGKSEAGRGLCVRELTALQISFGPGLFPDQEDKAGAIELEEIALEVSDDARAAGGVRGGR